ncbi:Hemolymph protein 14, partial [Operophtera brumata]
MRCIDGYWDYIARCTPAAHCFWTDLEKQLPASKFAVAVGKLYRPWKNTKDDAQKSQVAGWGLTTADGKPSPVLRVVDLPYVEVGICINNGGGIAFSESITGVERYYLRGVASSAPASKKACNTGTYTSFTSITKHEKFIKQFWIES